MSFDKIQLPDFLMADLFKNSLVLINENIPQPASSTKKNVVPNQPDVALPTLVKPLFLGNNLKNVSIIVKDNEAVYLREEWFKFLIAILSACKLDLSDVAIFNHAHHKTTFSDLLATTAPKYLIMFDVDGKEITLPFTVPHYQIQPYSGCIVLHAPSLSFMLGNTEAVKVEKTKLWVSLKKMFNI